VRACISYTGPSSQPPVDVNLIPQRTLLPFQHLIH